MTLTAQFSHNPRVTISIPFLRNLLILVCLSLRAFSSEATCKIKTETSRVVEGDSICTVRYSLQGCINGQEYPALESSNDEEIIEIHQDIIENEFSASVNISLRLLTSGSTLYVINGVTNTGEERCLTVRFDHVNVSPEQFVFQEIERLLLIDGTYNLTVVLTVPDGENVLLAHQTFDVPQKNSHLLRVSGPEKECICSGCLKTSTEFFSDSGLLRIYFNKTNPSCNFTVTLFKYSNPKTKVNETTCSQLRVDATTLGWLSEKLIRNADKIPIDFPNTPKGCYTLRTFRGVFSPYFWLDTYYEIDFEKWNTSILLTPRYAESSLEVSWTWPEYPFNFTSWSLTVWYLNHTSLSCEGNNSNTQRISFLKANELTTNHHRFFNLTAGFYCARLSPNDYRCPRDGCTPRSSETVRLKGALQAAHEDKENVPQWMIPVLIFLGVVGGVCLASLCYKYNNRWTKDRGFYGPVPVDHCRHLERVSVLLIWTRFALDEGSSVEPAVNAFKDLLKTYAKCKIYDYLDPENLEKRQRQYLMSNPTEWLSSHLKDTKEKIIIIDTEGAKFRQKYSRTLTSDNVQFEDSLDELLFPFALRYLNETSDMSTDYSKIFLVKFSDMSSPHTELEGIVPWMRFTIPLHMRNLALKLRGLSDDLSIDFPPPSEDRLQSFESALSLSKNQRRNYVPENSLDIEDGCSIESYSIYSPT